MKTSRLENELMARAEAISVEREKLVDGLSLGSLVFDEAAGQEMSL